MLLEYEDYPEKMLKGGMEGWTVQVVMVTIVMMEMVIKLIEVVMVVPGD